jgi:hypothetical protein
MRGSTYPSGLKNYLKLVPSCTIFLYLVTVHPVIVWNQLNHAKERIERIYFRRTPFEKWVSRRDDYLRLYYQDMINWQPTDGPDTKRDLLTTN